MAKWGFTCTDNGRKKQAFTVTAGNKQTAERKAFQKARKAAKGDIISWSLRLNMA